MLPGSGLTRWGWQVATRTSETRFRAAGEVSVPARLGQCLALTRHPETSVFLCEDFEGFPSGSERLGRPGRHRVCEMSSETWTELSGCNQALHIRVGGGGGERALDRGGAGPGVGGSRGVGVVFRDRQNADESRGQNKSERLFRTEESLQRQISRS